MNEQELNRKLAEWADTKVDCWQCHGLGSSHWLGRCLVCNSTGKLLLSNSNVCPDFTQSLDDCFKWLVPKGDVSILMREVHHNDGKVFTQVTVNKDFVDYYGDAVEGQMEDKAALALCLAIEKLFDN